MPSDRHSGIQGGGKGAPKRGYCAFRRTPFRRLSRPWRARRDWIDPKTRWQGQNWYAARMPHRYKASSWHGSLVLMQKELKSSGSETLFLACCTPNSHECAGAPTRKIARRSSAASRSMRWAWYWVCSLITPGQVKSKAQWRLSSIFFVFANFLPKKCDSFSGEQRVKIPRGRE